MNDDRMETLLLQLIQDMAYVKSKLDNIEEQQFSSRIDKLEAQNERHEHELKALENRCNKMEEFTRNNLNDSNKATRGAIISAGLAVFGAIVSLLINML